MEKVNFKNRLSVIKALSKYAQLELLENIEIEKLLKLSFCKSKRMAMKIINTNYSLNDLYDILYMSNISNQSIEMKYFKLKNKNYLMEQYLDINNEPEIQENIIEEKFIAKIEPEIQEKTNDEKIILPTFEPEIQEKKIDELEELKTLNFSSNKVFHLRNSKKARMGGERNIYERH